MTIENVKPEGSDTAQTFHYTVTVFDPDQPGTESAAAKISIPTQGVQNAPLTGQISNVTNGGGYQWRVPQVSANTWVDGAQDACANFTAEIRAATQRSTHKPPASQRIC